MTEQRRKILVADDEISIQEILSIQLARMGYEVVLAGDGVEAVSMYEAEKPDLVLLDVLMPRLNGLGVCRRIREIEKKFGRRVPVLFLTARDSTHDKTSAALSSDACSIWMLEWISGVISIGPPAAGTLSAADAANAGLKPCATAASSAQPAASRRGARIRATP